MEVFEIFLETLKNLWAESGLYNMDIPSLLMIGVSFLMMYLAIAKGFEPLLLLPIAFGMFLTNLPGAEMY
ncbi:MAG: sodium ion-translocating decarboxylase subunit beta, partial [Oscillospiraceae bacterium]|nr:sodium ion-translocating decarboxylase subunit beta [Oscillospiraceae bacterium]